MNKRKFIVFEGIDGSGKTTQVELIAKWLESTGESLLVTKEPGGTELGAYLRNVLTGRYQDIELCPEAELLLFAADRIQHVKEVIVPALLQGKTVLCDRFTASTTAYQGYGRGLNKRLVGQINRMSTAGLLPDLTVYLDLDVETALQRIAARGAGNSLDKEKVAFYQKVRTGYRNSLSSSNFVIIKADQSIGTVTQEIIHAIKDFFHDN